MKRSALAAVPLAMAALTAGPAGRPGGPPTVGPTTPIKHVVIIYLENHSFDSLLGFWCDENPGRCPDGGMPASVTLSDGTTVTPSVDRDTVPNINHEQIDQVNAINGGKMNGWQLIPGCAAAQDYACVSGYQPWQEPNLALLARVFAISDMTFSMQDSPSWFGHLYAVAASTDGFNALPGANPWHESKTIVGAGWGCDSNKVAAWTDPYSGAVSDQPSCIPDPSLPVPNGGAYAPTLVPQAPTILDSLKQAGLTWRIYGPTCTSVSVSAGGLQTCTKAVPGYYWSVCPSFAELLYTQQCDGKLNSAGDGLVPGKRFIADATAGNLPAFSLVTPRTPVSEHNNQSMTRGDNWLGSLVQAVMNGPDWSTTAIFITWDDCGCFYDQVPPGANPDGTVQGPRVPLVIVSPYAKPGYTDTTPTTFAGILAYTEHVFGLAPLGVNDAQAYDFSNAFSYAQTPVRPVRMLRRPLPWSARHLPPAKPDVS